MPRIHECNFKMQETILQLVLGTDGLFILRLQSLIFVFLCFCGKNEFLIITKHLNYVYRK